MSKPSILLIPGSFAVPEFYTEVFDIVRANGHEIRGLHLPSVGLRTLEGREGAPPTMYDDAAFIAKEAEKLADEGKDVILIAHSYGGVPLSQSVKGLGIKERRKQDKKGGIVRLAYMTCLVPAIGQSAGDLLALVPEKQRVELSVDDQGWMYHNRPEATAAIILQHLPPAEGETWVKKFSKHTAVSFTDNLTYAGYKDIPVSYLLCEEDLCIPVEIQRAGIEMIEKESGEKVKVASIQADHCPNVTSLQKTVDWVLDLAEGVA